MIAKPQYYVPVSSLKPPSTDRHYCLIGIRSWPIAIPHFDFPVCNVWQWAKYISVTIHGTLAVWRNTFQQLSIAIFSNHTCTSHRGFCNFHLGGHRCRAIIIQKHCRNRSVDTTSSMSDGPLRSLLCCLIRFTKPFPVAC